MIQARDIVNASGALLNDVNLTNFTFAAQLPYLNMAMIELKEVLQLNSIPFIYKTDATITLPANTLRIGKDTDPSLPVDMAELNQLWERDVDTSQDYTEVTRKDYAPPFITQTTSLLYYWVEGESLKFIGATSPRLLRFDYIADPFQPLVKETDRITYEKAENFLKFRTAALCAQFIGENKERADDLNGTAGLVMDRVLGIEIKAEQPIAIRRKPFRARYRTRGWY